MNESYTKSFYELLGADAAASLVGGRLQLHQQSADVGTMNWDQLLGPRSRSHRSSLSSLLFKFSLLLLTFGGLRLLAGAFPSMSLDPETSLSEYPERVTKWGDLARHFPPTIPADASNAEFWDFPGELQAPDSMQLRITVPQESWNVIETLARSQAIYSYSGDADPQPPGRLVDLRLVDPNSKKKFPMAKPLGFTVYVLDQRGSWNHPIWRAIAFNPTTHEVVFAAYSG
jgi:hypothetical protein